MGCSTQAPNQLIYIYGGMRNELLTYDPNTNIVTNASMAPVNYTSKVSGCASDVNSFYTFGGISGNICHNHVYQYQQIGKTWSILPPNGDNTDIPNGRIGASVSLYQNELIVFGGYCPPLNVPPAEGIVYRYHYTSTPPTWTMDNSVGGGVVPPLGLRYHSANIVDKYLYIFGGISGNTLPGISHNDTYQYDLTTMEWVKLNISGKGPSPRLDLSSLVQSNRIIFFGGKLPEEPVALNDSYQLVLELYCLGKKCVDCVAAYSCGWCNSNSDGFQCIAGNSTSYVKQGACGRDLSNDIYQCPEEGLPSWAIALIVIGGVVVIGVIVFAIMKMRSQRQEYDPLH